VHYISKFDKDKDLRFSTVMKVNLRRPFVFLFTELIVALLSIYMAMVYAILYALFAAFPLVFEQKHHFSAGEGGLAFLGVGAGIVIGAAINPFFSPRMCEKSRWQGTSRGSISDGMRRWGVSARWDVLVCMDLVPFNTLDCPHLGRSAFRHGNAFHLCLHFRVLYGHLYYILREHHCSERPPPFSRGCGVSTFYTLSAC